MVVALTANRCHALYGIKPDPHCGIAGGMLKIDKAQARLLTSFGSDQAPAW